MEIHRKRRENATHFRLAAVSQPSRSRLAAVSPPPRRRLAAVSPPPRRLLAAVSPLLSQLVMRGCLVGNPDAINTGSDRFFLEYILLQSTLPCAGGAGNPPFSAPQGRTTRVGCALFRRGAGNPPAAWAVRTTVLAGRCEKKTTQRSWPVHTCCDGPLHAAHRHRFQTQIYPPQTQIYPTQIGSKRM